jgi:hypothetical protein
MLVTSLYAVTLAWCPINESWVKGYKVAYGQGQTTNWTPQIYTNVNPNDPCSPMVILSPGTNWLGRYTTFVDVGTNTQSTLTNLTPGETYYFVATAYASDGQESLPSNEVSYTVPTSPTNPPPKITYLGTRLEWWINMTSINRQNFNLMSFTNPPNGQFYRSYLILTNRGSITTKIVDLKTRLEWWTNMAYVNKQVFDLRSFTNPPNPQFYRSFLVITNNPF